MINGNSFYTDVSRYGNTLLYRGYNKRGEQIQKRVKYSPTLYIQSKLGTTEWNSIDDVPLDPVKFNTMREASTFLKDYAGMNQFALYGNNSFVYSFIQETFPNEIKHNRSDINVTFFDIETEIGDGFPDPKVAGQRILSLCFYSSKTGRCTIFALDDYNPSASKETDPNSIDFYKYDSEQEMLEGFLTWWNEPFNTPDIITGWNSRFFDIPYLVRRLQNVLGEKEAKRLSPWRLISERQVSIMKKPQLAFEITGIASIDYMDLFKKFAYSYGQQESYRLDHIAHVVLDKQKLDYSDIGTLKELPKKDHQIFLEYNIRDTMLLHEMDQKLGLIDIMITLSYMAGVNYGDTMGTTRICSTLIYRELCRKKKLPEIKNGRNVAFSFQGGYVKDPPKGMHKWIVSFDFASLYPNIIIQNNMSPETIVKHMKLNLTPESILEGGIPNAPADLAIAANGTTYRKDKMGIVPEVLSKIYDTRKSAKNEMIEVSKRISNGDTTPGLDTKRIILHNTQMAAKILANSMYGALANQYFAYFDMDVAAGITASGRLATQWIERDINICLRDFFKEHDIKDRVVAADTDSCYITLDDVVRKFNPKNPVMFLDEFCKKVLGPAIEKSLDRLYTMTQGYKPRLEAEREVIGDTAVWTAAKRYIINVHNSEGVQYETPKLKIMGIEAIKSSTPESCRTAMKNMFKIIMRNDECETQGAIRLFKEAFVKMPVEDIACPRGVTSVTDYSDRTTIYRKGTPINSRASLLYNHHIKRLGLDNKYRLINNGDKIKYVYLRKNNPIKENVIAFPDNHLPIELGLHEWIDHELQFAKTFLDPMKLVLNPLNWTDKPQSTLGDFFG